MITHQASDIADDEDIYTLRGPVKATASPIAKNDAASTYYNFPLRDHQPPIAGSENQLVTGFSKITKQPRAKPGPTTLPKPTIRGSLTPLVSIH